MKNAKRFHTTLQDETIQKMEYLKKEYCIRFNNDLITLLVDNEYNIAKKNEGRNKLEIRRNE